LKVPEFDFDKWARTLHLTSQHRTLIVTTHPTAKLSEHVNRKCP